MYDVVIGDISNTNILFDESNVYFIDFDGAIDLTLDSNKYQFNTLAFSNKYFMRDDLKTNDYISLGFVFYSMLIGGSTFIELDKNSYINILKHMVQKYFLPIPLYKIITMLINGECNSNTVSMFIESLYDTKKGEKDEFERVDTYISYSKLQKELVDSTYSLLKLNLNNFPTPLLSGNNLSFKYGKAGIVYSLIKSKMLSDQDIIFLYNNLLHDLASVAIRDMSFSNGLSGIIYTLLSFINIEEKFSEIEIFVDKLACHINQRITNVNESLSFDEGLSGIGWVLLKAYRISNKKMYLDSVMSIFKKVKQNYSSLTDSDKIGLSYGNSGIALLLAELYRITEQEEIKDIGINLLITDIVAGITTDNEAFMHPYTRTDIDILFPYFSYGTAGIAYVALKYFEIESSELLQPYLKTLINGLKVNFTVHLGFEKGAAGILYVLCKAYHLDLIDKKFIEDMVVNIDHQLYKKHKQYKILCPGYAMLRCSIDFATGSAGLLMAINELIKLEGDD